MNRGEKIVNLADFYFSISTTDTRSSLQSDRDIPSIKMERLPRYEFDDFVNALNRNHEGALSAAATYERPINAFENPHFYDEFYEVMLGSRQDWILWRVTFQSISSGTVLTLEYYSDTSTEDGSAKGFATLVVNNPVDLGLKFIVPAHHGQPKLVYRCIMTSKRTGRERYLSLSQGCSDRSSAQNGVILYTNFKNPPHTS